MAKARKVGEIRKAANETTDARLQSLELSKQEFASLQNITEVERKRYDAMIDAQKEKIRLDALQNEYAKDYNKLTTQQKQALDKNIQKQQEKVENVEKELGIVQRTNEELKKQDSWYKKMNKTIGELNKLIGGSSLWKFFMEADKGIKKTALQLGLSGERADILRFNMEQSSQYAASMGVSVTELGEAQAAYVEETGRALLLNEAGLKAIVDMGKSSGIGLQNASKLAAQYESIGINATSSADKVKGIVDTSERMGVSATKVLKKVSENFEAINKFAFKEGVDSFSKMAMYAERFKIDMGSMLDSAAKARTLEGAVELAAELQIMGGEFAKTDPFELLFLSRNDPEKYQKKINNMTKGIAQFRKTADGTFEAYISPMDLDRLERAGKALGLSQGEMAKQAKQMLKMQSISGKLIGTGLDKEDREMISGMAQFNSKTGEYFVNLKGVTMNVSKIGRQHLKALKAQNDTLEERTKASQTFDEAWQNTIMEFKTMLLPMIKGINIVLEKMRPVVKTVTEFVGSFMKDSSVTATLVALGGLLAGFKIVGAIISAGGRLLASKANIFKIWKKTKGDDGGGITSVFKKGGEAAKGAGKNAGKGMLRGGAGIGAAALGIGAGIGAAAGGISLLADAMSKLDEKQLETLQGITTSLGWFILGGVAAAVGVAALGATASAASYGLLAFGAAVLMVGAGVGIAAAGIGYMAEGLSTLGSADIGDNLLNTAMGLTSIVAALGTSTVLFNPLTMAGIATMATSVKEMSNYGSGMMAVGYGFNKIASVMNGDMSGLDRIKETIKSISEMDMSNTSALSSLSKLLSQPLKVEFADNKVALNVNATLELDGEVIYRKVLSKRSNITHENDARDGKDTIT